MPTKSKKAVKAVKAPAPKTDKVICATKNEITRPKAGGTTARIWEIADDITERTGKPAVRKEVLAQADKEKLSQGTAKTQYFRWRLFNGLSGHLPKAKGPVMPKLVPVKAVPSRKKAELKSPGKLPKPPAKKPAAPVAPVAPVVQLPVPPVAQ